MKKGLWYKDIVNYNNGDIIYSNDKNKFGEFIKYSKQINKIHVIILKKNSSIKTINSQVIALHKSELAFKKINNEYINQNPRKFIMLNNIPILIENMIKK